MSIGLVLAERAKWQAASDWMRDLDLHYSRIFGEPPIGWKFVGFAKPDPTMGPFDVKWVPTGEAVEWA